MFFFYKRVYCLFLFVNLFIFLNNFTKINKLDYEALFNKNKEVVIDNGLDNLLDCNFESIDFLLKPKICVKNNSSLILTNVSLFNCFYDYFETLDTSKIRFGNNVRLFFLKNNSFIFDSNYPLIIEGNVEINLMGGVFELLKKGSIQVLKGSSLVIKNGLLKISDENSIIFEIDSSLTFKNLKVELNSSFNIFSGSLFIDSKCKISSKGKLFINFLSEGFFKILPNATLILKDGLVFFYNPIIKDSFESYEEAKRHFIISDNSSTLILNNMTFLTVEYGICFDVGNIFIFNNVLFNNQDSVFQNDGKCFFIGPRAKVSLFKAANLTVFGALKA